MNRPSWTTRAVLLIALTIPQFGFAQRYATTRQGREVIVHSNPLPVVIHRLLPPNRGKHVSAKELQGPRRR